MRFYAARSPTLRHYGKMVRLADVSCGDTINSTRLAVGAPLMRCLVFGFDVPGHHAQLECPEAEISRQAEEANHGNAAKKTRNPKGLLGVENHIANPPYRANHFGGDDDDQRHT